LEGDFDVDHGRVRSLRGRGGLLISKYRTSDGGLVWAHEYGDNVRTERIADCLEATSDGGRMHGWLSRSDRQQLVCREGGVER